MIRGNEISQLAAQNRSAELFLKFAISSFSSLLQFELHYFPRVFGSFMNTIVYLLMVGVVAVCSARVRAPVVHY